MGNINREVSVKTQKSIEVDILKIVKFQHIYHTKHPAIYVALHVQIVNHWVCIKNLGKLLILVMNSVVSTMQRLGTDQIVLSINN